MSWAAWELGVWSWGCAPDAAADQAGGRSIRTTDGEHPAGLWGLVGDQGRLPVAGQPGGGWREILDIHTTRTVERMAGQSVVLCIQDTTELDFTSQPGIAGLGRLSHEAQHEAVRASDPGGDAGGVALGYSTRGCGRGSRKTNPTSKVSRWVEGYEIVADLAETPGYPLGVRGGSGRRSAGADRCRRPARHAGRLADPVEANNRKTTTGEKLWERIAQSEALGRSNSPAGGAGSPALGGAADALSHGGHAAGASRPTRRDRDRDPWPGRAAAGGE